MSEISSEQLRASLLAIQAVDAFAVSNNRLGLSGPEAEALEGKLIRIISMLRDGAHPFIHVGRTGDNKVAVTQATGELDERTWPLGLGFSDNNPHTSPAVGLRLKNVTGGVIRLSGVTEPKVTSIERIEDAPMSVGLAGNLLTEGEYAHEEIERAIESMGWLLTPNDNVLAVGNSAVNGLFFGLSYSQQPTPAIAEAIASRT
jgi:hypothetical protein